MTEYVLALISLSASIAAATTTYIFFKKSTEKTDKIEKDLRSYQQTLIEALERRDIKVPVDPHPEDEDE